jgi:hypothetical protein
LADANEMNFGGMDANSQMMLSVMAAMPSVQRTFIATMALQATMGMELEYTDEAGETVVGPPSPEMAADLAVAYADALVARLGGR